MGIRISKARVVTTIRFKSGSDVAEIDVQRLTGEDMKEIGRRSTTKGRVDHERHEALMLHAAIKGWRGFESEDGSERVFEDTPEAKVRILAELPAVYSTTVRNKAYGDVEVEEAALGN